MSTRMRERLLPFDITGASVRAVNTSAKTTKAKRGEEEMSPLVRRVIDGLQRELTEKNITPTKLAKDTGLDQGNLSRVFRMGAPNVSFLVIATCAKHLNVSLDALVGETPRMISGSYANRTLIKPASPPDVDLLTEVGAARELPDGTIVEAPQERESVREAQRPKGYKPRGGRDKTR